MKKFKNWYKEDDHPVKPTKPEEPEEPDTDNETEE